MYPIIFIFEIKLLRSSYHKPQRKNSKKKTNFLNDLMVTYRKLVFTTLRVKTKNSAFTLIEINFKIIT
ncbi:hypothetical protein BpHYR1_002613 [Brachionus plicatilis]|uniref:Uncharacterized protein n=1 Tax=Brachionus plicatilis TaxID=10195 RepID=A0A3M7RZP7_BRAPC|nr:hypothetical protein BpHYR1_002613 [Brachionus plicatilis]